MQFNREELERRIREEVEKNLKRRLALRMEEKKKELHESSIKHEDKKKYPLTDSINKIQHIDSHNLNPAENFYTFEEINSNLITTIVINEDNSYDVGTIPAHLFKEDDNTHVLIDWEEEMSSLEKLSTIEEVIEKAIKTALIRATEFEKKLLTNNKTTLTKEISKEKKTEPNRKLTTSDLEDMFNNMTPVIIDDGEIGENNDYERESTLNDSRIFNDDKDNIDKKEENLGLKLQSQTIKTPFGLSNSDMTIVENCIREYNDSPSVAIKISSLSEEESSAKDVIGIMRNSKNKEVQRISSLLSGSIVNNIVTDVHFEVSEDKVQPLNSKSVKSLIEDQDEEETNSSDNLMANSKSLQPQ